MEAYRQAYRLIFYMGQRSGFFIGAAVIVGFTLLGGSPASAAIPYGTLWLVACGTMRLLIVVLPRPSGGGSSMPGEKALPKAALAVSITPPCPPEACPGRPEMINRLPPHIRTLIG